MPKPPLFSVPSPKRFGASTTWNDNCDTSAARLRKPTSPFAPYTSSANTSWPGGQLAQSTVSSTKARLAKRGLLLLIKTTNRYKSLKLKKYKKDGFSKRLEVSLIVHEARPKRSSNVLQWTMMMRHSFAIWKNSPAKRSNHSL